MKESVEPVMSTADTAPMPVPEYDYRIETLGMVQNTQFGMNYYVDMDLPIVVIDHFGNGDPSYKRIQVWVKQVVDPTLVSDYQAMTDALPADSPRKATMQNITDTINNTYEAWHNPPVWDLP